MKHMKILMKKINRSVLLLGLTSVVASCGLNPQTADIDLNATLPEAKLSIYQDAVRKLGMMSVIYGAAPLNIMSKNIADNTGTSAATKAEIPRDITEIVKSTLNAVGGNVTFIPYDPDFFANSMNTGYSNFENKLIPEVVVSGGITEFDRALVTKGDSAEAEVSLSEYGLSFEDRNKGSLAQVTLDFNMIDFNTLAGIPRIQAVNGIKLHKAVKEDSLGFTVKSVTFGAQGTIKKVQGRHAAVRLLVELSMVQLVGRYQKVPYWRLLPGGVRDEVVIDRVLTDFYEMTEAEKIVTMQSYLHLYGYSVQLTGQMDLATQVALKEFSSKFGLQKAKQGINQETYLALFENIPVNHKAQYRSRVMKGLNAAYAQAKQVRQAPPAESVPALNIDGGKVALWTNKTDFAIGENMAVSFSVDKPMYVRIVVINSAGDVSTLFPNIHQNDSYCKPGVLYQVPPLQADFTLDVSGPAGTDKIRAIASSAPIGAEALHFTQNGDFDESKMAKFPVRASADIVIH